MTIYRADAYSRSAAAKNNLFPHRYDMFLYAKTKSTISFQILFLFE